MPKGLVGLQPPDYITATEPCRRTVAMTVLISIAYASGDLVVYSKHKRAARPTCYGCAISEQALDETQ